MPLPRRSVFCEGDEEEYDGRKQYEAEEPPLTQRFVSAVDEVEDGSSMKEEKLTPQTCRSCLYREQGRIRRKQYEGVEADPTDS